MKKWCIGLTILIMLFTLSPALGEEAVDWQNDPLEWVYVGNGTVRALQERRSCCYLPVTLVFMRPDGTENALYINPYVFDLDYEFYIYRDITTGAYTGFSLVDRYDNPRVTLVDGLFDYGIVYTLDESGYNAKFQGSLENYDLVFDGREIHITYNKTIYITARGVVDKVETTTVSFPIGWEDTNAVTKVGPF